MKEREKVNTNPVDDRLLCDPMNQKSDSLRLKPVFAVDFYWKLKEEKSVPKKTEIILIRKSLDFLLD